MTTQTGPKKIRSSKKKDRVTLAKKTNLFRTTDRSPKTLPGESIGLREKSISGLILKVEQGFAYGAVEKFRKHLCLNLKQVADAIQITPKTLERRKKEGKLHSAESEKLLRYTRLFEMAVALFEGDEREAVEWLNAPNYGLRNMCPLKFAKTEVGAREVEALIVRLEHGVF